MVVGQKSFPNGDRHTVHHKWPVISIITLGHTINYKFDYVADRATTDTTLHRRLCGQLRRGALPTETENQAKLRLHKVNP